ncbi:MAG: pyridoxal-dependent decarboxylase [Pseudobdellovibrio sp.]
MKLASHTLTYQRTILYQTEEFEIVSCLWTANAFSPLHGHGYSQCFTLIEEGTFENTTDFGNKKETITKSKGQVLITPTGAKHEIICTSSVGKTLHVYFPKISLTDKINNFKHRTEIELQKSFDVNLKTIGISFEDLTAELALISENSITTNSLYFMNQLFSGISSQMLIAEDLIAKTKTTMATHEASPALSTIETEVIQKLCQQIGWHKDFSEGIQVPGGSTANFMALHCARHNKYPDYKQKGLPHISLKIFGSLDAHYSLKKACVVLGLGLDSLVLIKTDLQGKMCPRDLENKINEAILRKEVPLIVYATAGTTVYGSFDPITEIAQICKNLNIWLHVDAAWGGPVLFSNSAKNLIAGIELADSVTFDAHKFFGAGLTCAFFLTQHPEILFEANDVSGADYIFHETETIDRGRLSWQCGRRADAVTFWTLWKSLGTSGLTQMIDISLNLSKELAEWVKTQPRLNLIHEPDFLNICVQVIPKLALQDRKLWSKHVRTELLNNNLAMVNYSSESDGTTFLRLIIANSFLTLNELKNILTWAQEI